MLTVQTDSTEASQMNSWTTTVEQRWPCQNKLWDKILKLWKVMGNSVAGIHNYRKRETLVSRGSYFQHYDCQATEKTALVRDIATAGSHSSLHCLAYGLIYVFSSVKKDTLNAAKKTWNFPTFLPHSRFLQVRLFAVITTVTFSYILFSCSVPLHMRSSTGSTKCVLLYKTISALSPPTSCYSTMKKNSLLQACHTLQCGRARTARTSL